MIDIDAPRASQFSAVSMWGPFQGKADRSGRLGDVVLVPDEASMGTVAGSVAWADGTRGPDLSGWRVRIASESDEACWLQVRVGTEGAFEFALPAGEYAIGSPFLIYDTPADPIYDLRLGDAGLRSFTVMPG